MLSQDGANTLQPWCQKNLVPFRPGQPGVKHWVAEEACLDINLIQDQVYPMKLDWKI